MTDHLQTENFEKFIGVMKGLQERYDATSLPIEKFICKEVNRASDDYKNVVFMSLIQDLSPEDKDMVADYMGKIHIDKMNGELCKSMKRVKVEGDALTDSDCLTSLNQIVGLKEGLHMNTPEDHKRQLRTKGQIARIVARGESSGQRQLNPIVRDALRVEVESVITWKRNHKNRAKKDRKNRSLDKKGARAIVDKCPKVKSKKTQTVSK